MTYDDKSPTVPTLYVGRTLDLPPLTAQAAFDAHRQSLTCGSAQETWALETGSGELRIFGSGFTSRSGPACALRRADAQLRPGRRRWAFAIEVEVEIMPWSDDSSQIGIRPRDRRVPMADSVRRRRYLAIAVEAAAALACALEGQVEVWLLTQLPEPGEENAARVD
jgi:hypothetical protein